jgi:hypothetical protein
MPSPEPQHVPGPFVETGPGLAALAAPAEASAAKIGEMAPPGTDSSHPGAAADRLLFPGFRRTTISTEGVLVKGATTSCATINTLVGGEGPPLLLIHEPIC